MSIELPELCECMGCSRTMLLDECESYGKVDSETLADRGEPDGRCPWCGDYVYWIDKNDVGYGIALVEYAVRVVEGGA